MLKRLWPWFAWVLITGIMSAYLASRMNGPDATVFLPGATTHGHHQIEVNCNVCHDPMMGVKEQACLDCHGEDLEAVNDSHPKSKFTDPRNADRVAALDARRCVTCHREHVPDQTRAMGLTLPEDYCALCHQETLENRASHAGLGFDTCATAGCHNFHDNSALYEDFLERHLDEPDIRTNAVVLPRHLTAWFGDRASPPLSLAERDAPASVASDKEVDREWLETSHAAAGVNCTTCHNLVAEEGEPGVWTDRPDQNVCARCHEIEAETFMAGKHGMRLAQGLSPMTPDRARLPMKPAAAHRELTCVSCHSSHRFDTVRAAVEACISCHDDEHTKAYRESAHQRLWRAELAGEGAEGSGVSCATCHMPRMTTRAGGDGRTYVTHNQSFNLQPNEKMVRSVCMNCHGVGFILDALADPGLISSNFQGEPSRHVESVDWVKRRVLERQNQ